MGTIKLIFIILSAVLTVTAIIFICLIALNVVDYLHYDDAAFMEKAFFHIKMMIFFLLGGFISWFIAKTLDLFFED